MFTRCRAFLLLLGVQASLAVGCAPGGFDGGDAADSGLDVVEEDAAAAEDEADEEDAGEGTVQKASALTLTVIKQGSGSGTVLGNDILSQVINCGTKCSQSYLLPTTVTLTASPSAGSVFAGWSGGCTGTALSCTVNVGLPGVDVYARFEAQRTLTVSKTGAGTGTVTGTRADTGATVINCGSDCSETVVNGTKITLKAVPASGSGFVGWSGACTGTATTCTVTMSAARSVTANFAVFRSLNLTYTLGGSPLDTQYDADSAHFSAVRLDTGASLTFPIRVPNGTSIKITPINKTNTCPKSGCSNGWGFVGWNSKGACAAFGKGPCTLTMTANKSAIGVFCQGRCLESPL